MPNKSKVFSIPIFVSIASLLASPVFATIIRVPQDQPTIQAGIDSSVNGDTVIVFPGTYSEHISFRGKEVILQSVAGPESTEINAIVATIPVVIFPAGIYSPRLEGFKINSADDDPAVLIEGGTPTIVHNVFTGNDVGVWINAGVATIDSNQISDLFYGIVAAGGNVTIRRNIIRKCFRYGIGVWNSSNCNITNNVIVQCVVEGAIAFFSGFAEIKNNIIAFNQNYGIHSQAALFTIDYNDVFANNISNYFGTLPGAHDISIDPLFIDTSAGDFHLLPNSPCIDAGDPVTPVPNGGGTRVDMGAFEYLQYPQFSLLSPSPNAQLPSNQPLFLWESLHDSIQSIEADYSVFLSTNSSFMPTDMFPTSSDTFWQASFPLDFHQTYFWKVMAVPDSADTFFSLEARNFKIIDAPPGSFSLTTPPNNIKIVTKSPVLQWSNANDPDPVDTVTYTAIISSDSGFLFAYSQPNLASNSFMVPLGVLNRGLSYFWKVKASDTQDSTTFSNEIFRFRLLYLGDVNGDGILSPADIVLLLNHVFLGAPVDPPEAADMNCDGNPSPADVVLGLNAIFLGQPPPCDP